MTRSEVEAMLRKQKEKASASSVYLDLKPLHLVEVATNPVPLGYTVQILEFMAEQAIPRSMLYTSSIPLEPSSMILPFPQRISRNP